jgi:hypothetical protein
VEGTTITRRASPSVSVSVFARLLLVDCEVELEGCKQGRDEGGQIFWGKDALAVTGGPRGEGVAGSHTGYRRSTANPRQPAFLPLTNPPSSPPETFINTSMPVVDYYKKQGKVVEVRRIACSPLFADSPSLTPLSPLTRLTRQNPSTKSTRISSRVSRLFFPSLLEQLSGLPHPHREFWRVQRVAGGTGEGRRIRTFIYNNWYIGFSVETIKARGTFLASHLLFVSFSLVPHPFHTLVIARGVRV